MLADAEMARKEKFTELEISVLIEESSLNKERLKNGVTNKLKAGIWRKITERVSKNHLDLHLDLDLDLDQDVETRCRMSIIACPESISKFKIDMAHLYKDLDLCQVAGLQSI